MKNFELNKIFIFAAVINLLLSCGYQPILNKDNQDFSVSKFNLEGNKRIAGLLKNNLISTKKALNVIELNIKSEKKRAVSNKSQSGKVLTYSVTLTFEVTASGNENILFNKVYTKSQNYSAADVHSDTLNNEKKVVESLIESIASELQIELNSIF
tara:strand:- start:290 stop:754 length:465 start_codon:yes stop_codon:yes gene_type:complete